ncbi:hypothetical protein [Embleya sp. MST-111070]|uniref:hypothetical protein n=1 Tax=Embleya sp. MST-111070 TaxID=3398231 RepID=UPI003F740308
MRDREAERVRKVLRWARCREFSDRRGGFVVEGGEDDGPFALACASESLAGRGEVGRYAVALRAAGYHVEPDEEDDASLLVWRPGTAPQPPRAEPTPARELVARVLRTVTVLGDTNTPPSGRWDMVARVNAVEPITLHVTSLSPRDEAAARSTLHHLSVEHSRSSAAHLLVIAELLAQLGEATGRPREDVLQGVALALERALPPETQDGT